MDWKDIQKFKSIPMVDKGMGMRSGYLDCGNSCTGMYICQNL